MISTNSSSPKSMLARFFQQEAAGGILLMIAAVLAIFVANSPLRSMYSLLIETPVAVMVGNFEIAKPLLLWVNDGLMAVFFLLVGLELKRELMEGELSDPRQVVLPALGAVGGMAVPALCYVALNWGDATAIKGWAIPAATDIAFALGVLSLLGSRVPISLKVFLTSLAIFDDIGAIVVIALFYTSKISAQALGVAAVCLVVLFVMNRRGATARSVYFAVGLVMWVAVLKSGVHATLAGVALALFVPMKNPTDPEDSPLKEMEHDLHSAVAFIILPIFAFCNAGLDLRGIGLEQVTHPVPMGIALGLVVGKQLGIFSLCWLGLKLGWAKMPKGMSMASLYGTAALCGIGFTMSLFIGSLAFEETGINMMFDERLGIILGSLISGVVGVAVLNAVLPKTPAEDA